MAKISVITICYNNLVGLRRTFESVNNQTYRHEIEYIIIDGGSKDGSFEFLKEHNEEIDYWVSEPDNGIYNAMNKGVKVATGEYCIFMNSGDLFASLDVVEKSLPYLDGTDFVYSDMILYYPESNKKQLSVMPEKITGTHCTTYTLPHQSTFIRTYIQKRNLYKEFYKIVGDYAFFVEELIMKGASTKKIPDYIGMFYMDGVSIINEEETCRERIAAFENCIPKIIVDDLRALKFYRCLSKTFAFRLLLKIVLIYIKMRDPLLYKSLMH